MPKQVGKGRKRVKIKIFIPICSYPTRYKEFQKIRKTFKKLKNLIISSFQAKTSWERLRKCEKKKIIVPIYSYPTRYKEFQKIAKQFKKLKKTIMASFQAKTSWESPRESENENFRSD